MTSPTMRYATMITPMTILARPAQRTEARSSFILTGVWRGRNGRYSGRAMGGKPKDDNATRNLKPGDITQRAKKGTKIGLFPRGEVMAALKKVIRAK